MAGAGDDEYDDGPALGPGCTMWLIGVLAVACALMSVVLVVVIVAQR